jgi:hypothetical protein
MESKLNSGNSWCINAAADTNHPNRHAFKGVLTVVDSPSDKAPSGARGHRVILTHTAAKAAIPSLIGMAVGYKEGYDGHNAKLKVGIITHAELIAKELIIEGYLFARDFPEVISKLDIPDNKMGLSYELADAHVADMRAEIWTLTRAAFTGAAILLKSKAAYSRTSFQLLNKIAKGKAA